MEPHDEQDEVQDAEDFDPTEVFTVDDMLAEDEILEDMVEEEFKANINEEASSTVTRRPVDRVDQGGTYQGIDKQAMMILSLIIFLQILSTLIRCSVRDLGCISRCSYALWTHLVIGLLISHKELMQPVGMDIHHFKSVRLLLGC